MVGFIILVLLMVGGLYGLHYGYKLAFYNDEPFDDPYNYPKDGQYLQCEPLIKNCIGEFEKVPFERVSITSYDGLKLFGRYYHIADDAPLKLMFHGYKGNAIRDFCGSLAMCREAGMNMLVVDQRCHGESQGHTITFGIKERYDCLSWIQYARERFGDVPMMLSGVSMGAATVLMDSGLELPANVKGIIADCPYDAPSNIIKKVLGEDMGMPVKIVYPLIRFGGMLYGKFNLDEDSPVESVKRAKVPILLIHGDDDRFVPWYMSENIHAAAPEKIEFHTVPGAGHALCYMVDRERYHEIVHAFTKRVMQ